MVPVLHGLKHVPLVVNLVFENDPVLGGVDFLAKVGRGFRNIIKCPPVCAVN